jgi:Siphovirus Gp157
MSWSLKDRAREVADLWRSVRAVAGEDDQTVLDTVEGETDAVDALREAVRLSIEADAHAAACRALEVSYAERRKVLEDRSERYRMAAASFLQTVGEKTVRLPEGTITWRDASEKILGTIPPPSELPDSCVKFQRVRDEAAMRKAMKDGLVIPGAYLSNGGVALTIRKA